MAKFSAAGVSGALSTSLKSVVGVRQPATPLDLIGVYCVVLGSTDTTTDSNLEYTIQRYSTAGTSTSVTPTDVEDLAQTNSGLAGQTFTAEPTVVSNSVLLNIGVNQRGAYQLVMAPGYEWNIALTANRQITIAAKHASATPTTKATIFWKE
jgi:hypothetical protein